MSVSAILDSKGRDVATASSDTSISAIAEVLATRKIGAVVVVDGDAVVGIVSERDIVRVIAREGGAALSSPASSLMTRKVVTCGIDETLNDLMEKMTTGRFRHLPVVENGALAGIISIGDVVKARIAEHERESEAMRSYIASA